MAVVAQGLVKHIARLRWIDANGREQSERHVAWDARLATTWAYRRAKSMIGAGEARSFHIDHTEIVAFDDEPAPRIDPAFALPALPDRIAA